MARIAIIGSGISGLGLASLLHLHHSITVYEQSHDIGGHSRTRHIIYKDKKIAVDTGFIVFNYRNYPHLSKLFTQLDVPVEKSNMTFGVTINDGEIEWGAQNLNAVFAQRRNLIRPKFIRLITDVMRFNAFASSVVEKYPHYSLQELLQKMKMSDWFASYYILPMGGAIWSCSLKDMLTFPALNFIRFFKAHGLLTITGQPQWYTVSGGSEEYVKRLIAPFKDRIRKSCAAVSIRRENNQVQVTDSLGETTTYDHVILASHADQSLALLQDVTAEEKSVLSSFKYSNNKAILHNDTSIMPKRRNCWSSWVYHSQNDDGQDGIPVTYWMNKLQNIDSAYPLFVTLNPHRIIAKEHIFDEHIFEHPIYSPASAVAQSQIPSIQGKQNTWFCGAYMGNGFHEDGLASAVEVAKKFGVDPQWL